MRTGVLVALLGLLPLAACTRRAGNENLGLAARSAAPAVDVGSHPSQLLSALALPGGQLDRLLGAHGIDASSKLRVEAPGAPPEILEESYRLDSDGHGALHLRHDNSHGGGTEAIAKAGELFVRPRYGRFIRRRPEPEEVDRLRSTVEGVAASYLALLARHLDARAVGPVESGGRHGVKLALALATPAGAAPRETEPGRRWRESLVVRALSGEAIIDAATGAPLAIQLDAVYSFVREGKGPVEVRLSYQLTTRPAEPVLVPEDAVAAGSRPRPMLDRQALLEGLSTARTRGRHD